MSLYYFLHEKAYKYLVQIKENISVLSSKLIFN